MFHTGGSIPKMSRCPVSAYSRETGYKICWRSECRSPLECLKVKNTPEKAILKWKHETSLKRKLALFSYYPNFSNIKKTTLQMTDEGQFSEYLQLKVEENCEAVTQFCSHCSFRMDFSKQGRPGPCLQILTSGMSSITRSKPPTPEMRNKTRKLLRYFIFFPLVSS